MVPMKTHGIPLAVLLTILALGCTPRTGGGEPTGPSKIVSCGGEALAHCAPDMLGPTNECLAGSGDIVSCLMGFTRPAACAGLDIVACMVRHEGAAAKAAAASNPNNTVDARRSARAEEFLRRKNVAFAD